MTETRREPARLPFIDGLRGLAILGVVACHTWDHFQCQHESCEAATGLLPLLASHGAFGVDLFFIVSAFTLVLALRTRAGEPVRNFYLRRAFRILPLWWIAILFYAVARHRSFVSILPSLTFTWGFIRYIPHLEVFDAQWSIFVEEIFYLILPFLIAALANRKAASRFFALTLLLSWEWSQYAFRLGIPTSSGFIAYSPLNYGQYFALGILFTFCDDHAGRLKKWGGAIALLAVAALLAIPHDSPLAPLAAVGPLAIVFWCARANLGWLGRLTRTRLVATFGRGCYSIYLAHLAVLHYLQPFRIAWLGLFHLEGASPEAHYLVWLPPVLLLNLGLGMACHSFLERPCIRLGRKVIGALETQRSFVAAPARRPS